jgi:ribonuclease BN (tRNA processing enzyme)
MPLGRLSSAFLNAYEPTLTEEQGCFRELQNLSIDPASIKYVLLSHLHWDHTGAVGRFRMRCISLSVGNMNML